MNFIKFFAHKLSPKEIPMLLGRWRIEKCTTQMSNKIDLSNEDHCGTCGEYALAKRRLFNPEFKVPRKAKIIKYKKILLIKDL